jgi:hypothetical protein
MAIEKGKIKPPEPGHSLADLYPEIAAEANGWDPFSVRWGSDVKLSWKCAEGHFWIAAVVKRSRMGRGCPYCSNHKVLSGYNDLKTHYPDVAIEAYGWDPLQVSSKSKRKLEWKCAFGHRWFATVGSRTALGNGCPICGNKITVAGINDLQTLYPDVALEAVGWDPSLINPGANKKRMWKCKYGHHWEAQVATRALRGYGCPICGHQKLLKGFNDLATTHPEVASEAHGWDPATVIGGTHAKKMWKCKLGHIYISQVQHRRRGVGCPFCSNTKLLAGFNDLATTHPELATQAHGWDPKTVIGGTHSKKQWQCNLGHTWETSPKKRAFGIMNNCPICANKQVLIGFNDLATTNPSLAAEADGWDPTTLTYSSGKMRRWLCTEGHGWSSTVANRAKGNGCPTCAKGGFDPNENGYLYFLSHEDLGMYQIGITNYPDERLRTHKRSGWIPLEVRGPMDGHLTRQLETGILRSIKKRGAVFANKTTQKVFDGWSEAWMSASLEVTSFKELLDFLYEDD